MPEAFRQRATQHPERHSSEVTVPERQPDARHDDRRRRYHRDPAVQPLKASRRLSPPNSGIASFFDDMTSAGWRFTASPEDYYHKKYELTRTHSKWLSGGAHRVPAKALDLGCVAVRNSL